MEATRQGEGRVRGCVLLIPADLFQAAEREAERLGLSLEAYILALVDREVRQATDRITR